MCGVGAAVVASSLLWTRGPTPRRDWARESIQPRVRLANCMVAGYGLVSERGFQGREVIIIVVETGVEDVARLLVSVWWRHFGRKQAPASDNHLSAIDAYGELACYSDGPILVAVSRR